MTKFKCWVPDNGETIDDAKVIADLTVRQAAHEYARQRWDRSSPDYFREIVVRTSDYRSRVVDVEIYVEAVPEFNIVKVTQIEQER
jgi:hypothetical protein